MLKMQLGCWPSFQNVGGWQEGEARHLVEPRAEDGVVDKLLPEADLVQSTKDCLPEMEITATNRSVTTFVETDNCAFIVDDPSCGRNLAQEARKQQKERRKEDPGCLEQVVR